jgi:hypothetical protein
MAKWDFYLHFKTRLECFPSFDSSALTQKREMDLRWEQRGCSDLLINLIHFYEKKVMLGVPE